MKTLICLDSGTTNTRGWLVRGKEVLLRRSVAAGVRDTARTGSRDFLLKAIREVVGELAAAEETRPSAILASGMITSSLGIEEVRHLPAPAGVGEIAAGVRRVDLEDVVGLPIYLVPGVSSGGSCDSFEDLGSRDVMRGEETLCLGIASGIGRKEAFDVLNLGSHWKTISVSAEAKIERSVTSLTGEMIFAVQSQTVIASGLPKGQIETLDYGWAKAGMNEAKRAGLTRSAFCVRLLELASLGTPEQRMSFLIGAFVGSEMEDLLGRGILSREREIMISGGEAVSSCWEKVLQESGYGARRLTAVETESAYLAGLRQIYDRMG